MGIDVGQAISQLVGVVVGAGITGGISVYTFHRQRTDSLAAEKRAQQDLVESGRRDREINATALAKESLVKLLLLRKDPDADREREFDRRLDKGEPYKKLITELPPDNEAIEEWHRIRDSLIVAIDAASQDFANAELRKRLSEACEILQLYGGPEKHARQPESRTRHIVVKDALGCLGAFRRGDPLPDRSNDYSNTLEFAMLYLDEMESN